jgi:hypothetical protein
LLVGLLENLKDAAELAKQIGNMELYRKIIGLEQEVHDLSREKRRLENRTDELESALRFKATLVFRSPFYFAEGDDVPYCPSCWEKDRATIHMVLFDRYMSGKTYQCPQCKFERYP